MYLNNIVVEKTESLQVGVSLEEIGNNLQHETKYQHKNVNDLNIFGNDGSSVSVPSRGIMDIAKIWGIADNFSGIFMLTNKTKDYPYKYHVSIEAQEYTTSYECNSREILKEVNELERIIVAGRKLAGVDRSTGLFSVPTQLLLTSAMCNDPTQTIALLQKYETDSIIRIIKSPFFRHIYKLIHPKTTFIKTPTKTLDTE